MFFWKKLRKKRSAPESDERRRQQRACERALERPEVAAARPAGRRPGRSRKRPSLLGLRHSLEPRKFPTKFIRVNNCRKEEVKLSELLFYNPG